MGQVGGGGRGLLGKRPELEEMDGAEGGRVRARGAVGE